MLLQAHLQDGVEGLHVLGELGAARIGEGPHSQHGLLMHRGLPRSEKESVMSDRKLRDSNQLNPTS